MKYLINLLLLVIFGAIVFLSESVVRNAIDVQQHKSDLGELNHIYYGIFSVNAWKGQIKEILYAEVNRIDMSSTAHELRSTIEKQLTVIIDKLNERIRESNEESFSGKIKQMMIDLVVDIDEVKKGVPTYADALIAEVTSPETQRQVKKIATKQLKTYFAKTYQKQDTSRVEDAIERAGATDVKSARVLLAEKIEHKSGLVRFEGGLVLCLAIFLFTFVSLFISHSRLGFILLLMTLLVLMAIGVTTPMIDLEAKIAEMRFTLLGHEVLFENQMLYFQSKSVIDVFLIMLRHEDLSMQFVGLLMISFSVFFPLIKLFSTLIYYFDLRGVRKSRIINFFIFKSGKWSMADVMVIAIFMAYIGFNGIVTNQFKKISALMPSEIVFITTNGTSLQPGFFAFLAYVLLAMALSSLLERYISARESERA